MDYIFDTHAHYDDEAFDADREEVLTGLKEQGIRSVRSVLTTTGTSRRGRSRNTGLRHSLRSQRRRDSR